MENFLYPARVDKTGQITDRNLVTQFGDGYAQRTGDGINTKQEKWPLSFVGREKKIKPIKDFLDRHASRKTFLWTPPLGEQGTYVTPEGYQLTAHQGKQTGVFTLAVVFVESNRAIAP